MTTPEVTKPPESQQKPPEITEISDTIPETLAEKIEKAGGNVTPTQFTAQVTDDSGKPLIQTPQTATVTVQIPATPAQLADWSKGSPDNALTWFGAFWLRIIKKALHFGWQIAMKATGPGGRQ